jgi:hypothetical protein
MCAPHEVCGDVMMRAMSRLGFEALTLEPLRSYPPESGLEAALDGFECARIGAGGLPVIPRYPLGTDVDDLVLRAFLNLPLVVYGHHQDVEDGLDSVLDITERIRALGPVSWLSLSEIARSNYVSWRSGVELRVRLSSLRASLRVPDGVERLSVELPPVSSGPAEDLRVWFDGRTVPIEAGRDGTTHAGLPISSARTVRVEVMSALRQRFEDVAPPPARLWPGLRRATTEVRDRTAPLRHRIGRRASRTRTRVKR